MFRQARDMRLTIRRVFTGAVLCCATVVILLLLQTSGYAQVPTNVRDIPANDAARMVSQYRGSVVLFHIYASWSDLSKRELSDINRLGSTYGTRGLVLLAFSADQDPDLLAKFLGNNPLSFTPMRLTSTTGQELAAAIGTFGGSFQGSIPYTALFDRSGGLMYQWIGGHGFSVYSQAIEPLLSDGKQGGVPPAASGAPATQGAPSVASAGVSFTVQEHPRFKIAQKKPGLYMLTRDGKISKNATADPFFLAGSVYAKAAIADRKKFAEERLRLTGGIAGIVITESGELTIDNISGYEMVADARDTDLRVPVVMYQVVLFSDSRYYLMQGFTPPGEKEKNLQAFREIARSLRRQ